MNKPLPEITPKAGTDKTPALLQDSGLQAANLSVTSERKKKKDEGGGGIKNPDPKPEDNTTIDKIPTNTNKPSEPVDIKKILLEKAEADRKRDEKLGSITGTPTDTSGRPNRSDPPIEKPGKPQ